MRYARSWVGMSGVLLVSGVLVAVGCGSSDSGSGAGGGAGSGSGGAAGTDGGGSGGSAGATGGSGGTGGSAGTGGAGGSAGVAGSAGGAGDAGADVTVYVDPRCVPVCEAIINKACPNEKSQAECEAGCTLRVTNGACRQLWSDYLDCVGSTPTIQCGTDGGQPTDCPTEAGAAVACAADAGA